MKKTALYILSSILAYLSAFIAYSCIFLSTANESVRGEVAWLLVVTGIVFLLICLPIYLGVIHWIDSKYDTFKGLLYPLGCMLVFFIPTLAINLRYGSINLFSPESMLFHLFFLVTGAVFGLCHWMIKQERFPNALAYSLIAIGILAGVAWLAVETSHSYATPEEAFDAVEADVIAIPGYTDFFGRELLYFFIKDDHLGAAYAKRAPFGWKTDGISWSNFEPPTNYEQLFSYGLYGENLIYGFVKLEKPAHYQLSMDSVDGHIIHPLLSEKGVETDQMENVYIWYVSTKEPVQKGNLELTDKETGEVFDTLEFIRLMSMK